MVSSKINDKFDEWYLSNLSLIARETMQLLVNHQLIPTAIQPKTISLEQICYKKSQGIASNFIALSSFFDIKKQRLKTIHKKCIVMQIEKSNNK